MKGKIKYAGKKENWIIKWNREGENQIRWEKQIWRNRI
jgi:hypothetical protein